MSNTTRRRSRNLRLVLASLALLGIGAAITAAAWTDEVYVEVAADSGTFDVWGQVTVDGVASGFSQSDDSGDIDLKVELLNLKPGDSHDLTVQIQNLGSVTAYLSVTGEGLQLGDDIPSTCAIDGNASVFPASVAPSTTETWTVDVDVPADWGNECEGLTFVGGYLTINATSAEPAS